MNDNRISPHKDGVAAASAYVAQKMVSGAQPDAALISAGRTFDALVELFRCAERAWLPNSDAFGQACCELIAAKRAGTLRPMHGVEISEIAKQRADEIAPPPVEFDADDITSLLEPIERTILKRPAHTRDGLAVQCRVAKFCLASLWDEDKATTDLDWMELVTRWFIESVLLFVARNGS